MMSDAGTQSHPDNPSVIPAIRGQKSRPPAVTFAPKLADLKKIRVAAVSYLNTKPLLYGLRCSDVRNEMELIEDYPAKIARMLIDDEVDVGLIPVAATAGLASWNIVGDYCIGCNGPVASVCLFSDVPMEEVEKVLLDYQSKTSVNLAKILLREYWQKEVELMDATGEDYRGQIRGTTAGVVIGDRALAQRQTARYIYDLGEAWKAHTGLPFVFAAWISKQKLPAGFESRFNEANALGLRHLADVIKENPFAAFDLKTYFTRCIQYELTPDKREGLNLFLQKLKAYASQPDPIFRQ